MMQHPTNTVNGFGNRLRTYLLRDGLTEVAFAKSLGRKSGIAAYEKQPDAFPKASFLLSIAKVYPNWSLDYILYGVGEPYRNLEPPTHTARQAGYLTNISRWIDFKRDVDLDIKKLPLEGYKPLVERLQKATKLLHEENLAMLDYLEKMNGQY